MLNHKQQLEKANQEIEKLKNKVAENHWRLGYHVASQANWINDPNGFSYFNGEYHLFYQHHPYSPKWGPMHWGHVKSKDLVNWEHLPIALAPSEDYDVDGCFSGSAFEKDGKMYLMYTGNKWTGPNGDEPEKESHYISMLRENRVDGIIMCSHTLDIEEYKAVNFPIVTFDRIISERFPYVASDNYRGGEIATTHLIESGCKRLLHISGPLKLDLLANRRADAFKLTCMRHHIEHEIIEGSNDNLTFEYFSEFIENEISGSLSSFDGVFCSNDIVAYALYLHATERGIQVPEQLKIVGYDYHSFTRMLQTSKKRQ